MVHAKWLLCFLGIIFVLSTSVWAQKYPMLEDVRAVSVTIDHVGSEPNNPPVNWPRLQLHIARKISDAGISIEPVKGIRLPGIPDLNVTVMTVEIAETEQFVFHLETSLYRLVSISENSKVMISSPVWSDLATMQSVAAEDFDSAITKAATRQVGKFIDAWESAQSKSTAAEPNNKNTKGTQRAQHAVPLQNSTTESAKTYIASKSSKVFHLADCTVAKTISAGNLVTFASKDEAISSGRRPCKRCNP